MCTTLFQRPRESTLCAPSTYERKALKNFCQVAFASADLEFQTLRHCFTELFLRGEISQRQEEGRGNIVRAASPPPPPPNPEQTRIMSQIHHHQRRTELKVCGVVGVHCLVWRVGTQFCLIVRNMRVCERNTFMTAL